MNWALAPFCFLLAPPFFSIPLLSLFNVVDFYVDFYGVFGETHGLGGFQLANIAGPSFGWTKRTFKDLDGLQQKQGVSRSVTFLSASQNHNRTDNTFLPRKRASDSFGRPDAAGRIGVQDDDYIADFKIGLFLVPLLSFGEVRQHFFDKLLPKLIRHCLGDTPSLLG